MFKYRTTKLTTAVHITGQFHSTVQIVVHQREGTCMVLPLKHFATRLKILIGRNCAQSSKAG